MSSTSVTLEQLKEQGAYQTENRKFRRRDIWMVHFGDPSTKKTGEIAGYRPALLIQSNAGNNNSRNKIVIPITSSNIKLCKNLVTHTRLHLEKESVAQSELIQTVSEERFCHYVCTVSPEEMAEIEYRTLIALGITWVER